MFGVIRRSAMSPNIRFFQISLRSPLPGLCSKRCRWRPDVLSFPLSPHREQEAESIPSFAGEGVRLSHVATMGQPHSPPNRPQAEGGRSSLLSWDLLCGCRKAGGRPHRTGEQREVKVSREAEKCLGVEKHGSSWTVCGQKQRRVCKSFRP